ncbi:hypothetical protein DL770_011124 [Monosporascus sp. CRB-9-2]|nr:hypothetical protein DL770_011124 [Monosporascus sp. CRB-9-2]
MVWPGRTKAGSVAVTTTAAVFLSWMLAPAGTLMPNCADDQAVADQRVVAHAGNGGQILDAIGMCRGRNNR